MLYYSLLLFALTLPAWATVEIKVTLAPEDAPKVLRAWEMSTKDALKRSVTDRNLLSGRCAVHFGDYI